MPPVTNLTRGGGLPALGRVALKMLGVQQALGRLVKSRMPIPEISGAAHGRRLPARRQVLDGQVPLLRTGAMGRRGVRGFFAPSMDLPWITASKEIIRD
jgi:hypothetical protein